MSEIWDILGGDVSFWQGVWDWEKAAEAGWQFAFIRAGSITSVSGVCYTDDQFENNALYAPEHLPVGFYWYFRPNFDPIKQADYFCDLIRDKKWKLPPVIDVEVTAGMSEAAVTAAVVKFLSHVYVELHVWCLFYSRAYFMRDEMIYNQLFDECEIWDARYTTKPLPYNNPGDNPKFVPPWGKHTTVWQYIADSNDAIKYGGAGPPNGDDDVDLNRFHGTIEEFQAWAGIIPQKKINFSILSEEGAQVGAGWIDSDYVVVF